MDSLEPYVIYPFAAINRKIPQREKYLNTVIFTVIALMASEIPLFGGIATDSTSEVTFKVSGTLMQLGTQPFVFASMAAPFLFDKNKDKDSQHSSDILGLVLSVFMAFQWAYRESSWIGGLQLCAVAWALVQAEVYLKDRGAISPSTALIFANASRQLLLSIFVSPVSFVWTLILFVAVACIESLNVSVPLTHQKYRHQSTGMELPVMYNSTTALIMYYTLMETISTWYPPATVLLPRTLSMAVMIAAPCLYLGVYTINNRLASLNKQTGSDLINNWKKQKYTLKGWRDPKKMSKYIQNIIDRNVHWNTVFICLLWTLGVLYRPSVGITTLFILISVVQKHRPSWQLLRRSSF
jgi:preprotein translocase subunit SecY